VRCNRHVNAAYAEAPPPPARRSPAWLIAPLLAFAAVSLTVGLLARAEAAAPGTYPGGYFQLFFSDPIHLKAWFATAAVFLGCLQLLSAAWIYHVLPWAKPSWVNPFHRWTGRLSFVATLPVAYHCIFKLGFQHTDTRVLVHSFVGSAVYGAYAAKVTIVRLRRFPMPVIPIAGGLLFALLVAVWYTSAVWFFRLSGIGL
jgi:hypothetical protein